MRLFLLYQVGAQRGQRKQVLEQVGASAQGCLFTILAGSSVERLFPLPSLRAHLKCLHKLSRRAAAGELQFSLRRCVSVNHYSQPLKVPYGSEVPMASIS